MIKFKHKGNFTKNEKFLNRVKGAGYLDQVDSYGKQGVAALSAATPSDSGKTSECWEYTVEGGKENTKITWSNTNQNDGVNVAALIQYGHGTGTGGYVPPYDFVNPAMQQVFESITDGVWGEVTSK